MALRKIYQYIPCSITHFALKGLSHPGTREPGGGGSGGNLPHNFEAVGAPPLQLWTVKVVHFYFCLLLHVNLGIYQKIVGQIQGVFSFG